MTTNEFTWIYDSYADHVYRLALFIVGQKEDAEDIVQQTFTKLYQNPPVFNTERETKAWLLKTAQHSAYDLLKSAAHKKKAWGTEPEMLDNRKQILYPEPESVLSDERAILEGIARKYQAVLYLYYYEEYSTSEIAKLLGITETTVRTRLSRGRKQLKKVVGGKRI